MICFEIFLKYFGGMAFHCRYGCEVSNHNLIFYAEFVGGIDVSADTVQCKSTHKKSGRKYCYVGK